MTPKEFEKAIPKALEKMRHASREEQQLWDCLPSFVRRDFDLMGWFEVCARCAVVTATECPIATRITPL